MAQGDTARRRATYIKYQFNKIGIELDIEYSDWPTLQQKVHKGVIQMYMMGWAADYPEAENFLQLFYSPNIDKQTNNTCYENPAYDKLYDKTRQMEAGPERSKLYAEMINMISDDCPAILLSEPMTFVMIYDWVKNVKPNPIGSGYFKYWRIDADLRKTSGGRN